MKFRWVTFQDGHSLPILRAGIRRNRSATGFDAMLLIDTGAEGTLLPMGMAKLLGFRDTDLKPQQCRSAAGTTTVYAPKNLGLVEIDIEGREEWIRLPSLAFADGTYPLLGRDVLFANFELRMTSDEIELRWRSDRK